MSLSSLSSPVSQMPQGGVGTAFTDIRGMQAMETSSPEALKKVASQFESLFLDMWLQSMRDAGSVFAEGNPFSSQAVQVHQQLLDHQYAVHMSEAGGIGIGEALVAQLSAGSSMDQQQSLAGSGMLPDRTNFLRAAEESGPEGLSTQNFGNRSSLFDSAQSFIDELLPVVEKALVNSPLNPMAVLAQAALETGWGQKVIHDDQGNPSFNMFGIKSGDWEGESATVYSLENELGSMVPRQSDFRVYKDWQHSIQDYQNFLLGDQRYEPVMAAAREPEDFAAALQGSGYATDPEYATKLMDVMATIARKAKLQ